MVDHDNLSPELAKAIRESNARRFEKERQRDARRLHNYEADCLASWAERDKAETLIKKGGLK